MSDGEINPLQAALRARRWRLILGKIHEDEAGADGENGGQGRPAGAGGPPPGEELDQIDQMLEQLYGDSEQGDLSDSAPDIARWLGDIHQYFPAPVAQLLQRDALEKYKLRRLLAYPELLKEIEPDVNLVAEIIALGRVMPAKTRETAREVVRQVVAELLARLERPFRQALSGALNRAATSRRPRYKEINWPRTIHKNLKHYQPAERTLILEQLVGYGRHRSSLRDVILAVDTSASMGTSVVYGGIYAAVMASMPALTTRLILFDSSVVDLTDRLDDPVELLFGIKLGGGTDINRALTYAAQLVTRPRETTIILISDLFEGGDQAGLLRRAAELARSGAQIIVLLALDDRGAPRFNRPLAQELVNLDIPSFACTPDLFPELMGALLNGRDIRQWAGQAGIVTAPDN